ncbi:hypothetical protein [Streptomyces sp. NPDC059378]|uniref:hypothetical protein n=1 Tax=Streptomyces sp. NPDC059378 TaxID=3346815 RepID=UPI003686050E
MQGRTSARWARGLAAAVLAAATLVIAANAGPARAVDQGTGITRSADGPQDGVHRADTPAGDR